MPNMFSKDQRIESLVKELCGEGWAIQKSAHVKLRHPSGLLLVTSVSPSDNRSALNFRAAVRRARAAIEGAAK